MDGHHCPVSGTIQNTGTVTYDDHRKAGAELKTEQIEALVRSLALDERFSAVVAWLERNRVDFSDAGCRQSVAKDYGVLAHANGSVWALRVLAAQLTLLLNPPGLGGGITEPPGQDET